MADVIDAGQLGGERAAVVDHAADRHAAEADAVIAALAADQARARALADGALIGQRDLQRGIDRLRTGIGEEDAVEARPARSRPAARRNRTRADGPSGTRARSPGSSGCRSTALAISRRPWPALTHQRPAEPSITLRPSTVV